jgi:biopolymer transport protein ExbD
MALSSTRGRAEINVTPLIDVLLVLLVQLVVRVNADTSVVLVDEGREIRLEAGEVPAGLRAHLRDTGHVVLLEIDEAPHMRVALVEHE